MKKWWHYYAHTNNQVIYSLSPFRQDHVGPLFKKMPKNIMKKVVENFPDYMTFFVPTFGIFYWANGVYEDNYRSTWD
jgi:hypothetical protein